MIAEILFATPVTLDAESITGFLAERKIPLGDVPWTTDDNGMWRAIRGGTMRIEQRDTAIEADTLAEPGEDASAWWDTSPVSTHTHVVTVTLESTEHSAASTARLLVRLTAAVIDSTERYGTPAVAVFWNRERLMPPDFVQLHATTDPALGVLIGFRVGTPGSGYALRTMGLPALGLMNIEVVAFDGEIEAIAGVVQYWARELIVSGPVIEDGTTIGDSPANRTQVSVGPATWGGEEVYRFSFDGEAPAVTLPPLESIVCPECGEQVDAHVLHMGPMQIMQECPACGAGPVALLAQMLETMGGGDVTVTFETTNTVALASLLSEYDPRFDTVIEASDYLREHYDGTRAVVQLQRQVAGMISAVVTSEHPDIRMSADEALGVMDRAPSDTPIFHASPSDSTMEEAITAARASVGRFIARLEAPLVGDEFGVKVKIEDETVREVEHMWLDHLRLEGGEFVGVLEAVPQLVKNVRQGQELRIAVDQISDWGFTNGQAMYGNYTLRVMMGSMPKRMQTAFKSRLMPLDS